MEGLNGAEINSIASPFTENKKRLYYSGGGSNNMNNLRGNARGGARGSVRGTARGSARGSVRGSVRGNTRGNARGNGRNSQITMYNEMDEGNSDYDRGITMHSLDPFSSPTYQSHTSRAANAATNISNDAGGAGNYMMGSLKNLVYSNSNGSGGSPGSNGLPTDKSSNFSQYNDAFLDNTEASHMKGKNFSKRVGKNLTLNGINLGKGNINTGASGGGCYNHFGANKNAKGFRNRFTHYSKSSMKHGMAKQNLGLDDRGNLATVGEDKQEGERDMDNNDGEQQGFSLYFRKNQLSQVTPHNQQNVQIQYGPRSELYHPNDDGESAERRSMVAPNEGLYSDTYGGTHGDTLGEGLYDDIHRRSNQGVVNKAHSRNLYENRKLKNNKLYGNVGIDGEDNDMVNHLGGNRDLDLVDPLRASSNLPLSTPNDAEVKNVNNQNIATDKVHPSSNIHMTRNNKNNPTMNYTNVGKKRKNVKFDGNTFQKHKPKKNYYKSFNDSLERYSNNSLRIVNTGVKKGTNSSLYGNPEAEKELLDMNLGVNAPGGQVQAHSNDSAVVEVANISSSALDSGPPTAALNAPSNALAGAAARGIKTASRNNHVSNFHPSMKKKPFNNMTFSLNKYLTSYVNFDRIKSKKMNNGKVTNKGSDTGTVSVGGRNDADVCDSTLVNPGQNFDDRDGANPTGDESFSSYRPRSSEFTQVGNPIGGNLSELNNLAKNLNLELLKNLRDSLQNEMSLSRGNKDGSKVRRSGPSYIECLSEVSEISDDEEGDQSDKEKDSSAELGRNKNAFPQWSDNMTEMEAAVGMGGDKGSSVSPAANGGVALAYGSNQSLYGKSDPMQSLYSLYNNGRGTDANSSVYGAITAGAAAKGEGNTFAHTAEIGSNDDAYERDMTCTYGIETGQSHFNANTDAGNSNSYDANRKNPEAQMGVVYREYLGSGGATTTPFGESNANPIVKEEISPNQSGGKHFQGGIESSENYDHPYGDNHFVPETESRAGKKEAPFGSTNNMDMNELGEENEEEEDETEPFSQMRNEDLFINSYMPYPPEKYSSLYDLHEIKILSPHILKTKFHKQGKSSYHSSLKDGKLILLLDLDNTLLQATSFAKYNMELPLENFVDENGEPELYKFFLPHYNFFYYLKFRPYVRQFLQILSLYYELSIYTNATREYADVVIAILDPDRTLFADRIVARCNSADREENKNFSKIYPNVDCKYVIAFDDRKDVWTDIPHSHILKAEHYNFFELSKYDIISHFKEPTTCKKRFVDMDMHLHFMTKVLLKLHKQFFERPLEVDVGRLIDDIMLSTLSNVGVYFTGFRKNSKNSQHVLSSDCEDRQKEIALELGAKIYTNYDMPGVTHIIAAKNCTDNLIKSKKADYNHIQKVHTLWLYHCRGTLQSGNSIYFDADALCKIYNNKPPLHPKKDHWFFGNKDEMRKQDDTSECIKTENLKSRIFLGTGEYTNDAVICSPHEQINIKWIEKEVKLRQIYDTPGAAPSSLVGAAGDGQQRDKGAMCERTPHSDMSPLGEHVDEDDNFAYENSNVEEEEGEEAREEAEGTDSGTA
ncbi:hypothetical protein C922_01045 [Plasmodium inui San Antonio 1]|uniref:protein-serine/threonine phosphatase n=1 Tax=Plasmodium inui San Antonio 1 TaxID=1237626 RepID=W7AAA6_9APIC|nr:hypothetical protein C922_01045 [Plasmodium inui San Antonio 1]EUD68645.1 hypothetical protein C922_01045 [Plasmodium inui San Antonio 1]